MNVITNHPDIIKDFQKRVEDYIDRAKESRNKYTSDELKDMSRDDMPIAGRHNYNVEVHHIAKTPGRLNIYPDTHREGRTYIYSDDNGSNEYILTMKRNELMFRGDRPTFYAGNKDLNFYPIQYKEKMQGSWQLAITSTPEKGVWNDPEHNENLDITDKGISFCANQYQFHARRHGLDGLEQNEV